MRTVLRLLATCVAAIGTYYFVASLGGALIASILRRPLAEWLVPVTSAFIAPLVVCYIWIQTGSARVGLFRYVALGSLLTGTIAFSAGFFGPILFTPLANQGPLLGIFVTGPVGFILGGVGGAFYWLFRR